FSLPQIDAGRVAAIAPPSVVGGPLLIGAATGGVWRSTTRGASWQSVTDDQCALTTGALTVDPSNVQIVYAGTGEYTTGYPGCGVLRSLDGGLTWSAYASGLTLSNGTTPAFGGLLVDPATAGSATTTTVLGATRN